MVTVVDLSTPALLQEKQEKLFAVLRGLDRLIVAYSGGADSAYLAWAAQQVLGDRVLAITADSASMPESHKRDAERFVRQFGIPHEYVQTHEFDNPDYLKNDANRCFHCKDELFVRLEEIGRERGIPHIVYGVNADDLGDYRPGLEAAKNAGVRSPLIEADFTKEDVRRAAVAIGLSIWDKPASACLSSRIPFGTRVTRERLAQIATLEAELKILGLRQVRVRWHGIDPQSDKALARVEVAPSELEAAFAQRDAIVAAGKRAGFAYVTMDLQGYRMGSHNEVLVGRSLRVV